LKAERMQAPGKGIDPKWIPWIVGLGVLGTGIAVQQVISGSASLSMLIPWTPNTKTSAGRTAKNAMDMFGSFVSNEASSFGIPQKAIVAVMIAESRIPGTEHVNFKAFRQEKNDASYGLMQVLYGTAKGMGYSGPASGLYDPETSIHYGAKYLYQMHNLEVPRDPVNGWFNAFRAYNGGPGWRRSVTGWPKTLAYANRVTAIVNSI